MTRRLGRLLVALATLAAGLAPAAVATGPAAALPACTRSWTTATSGDWDDPTRWSGGVVPLPTDHVCIVLAGGYTVRLAGGATTVASLLLGAGPGTTPRTTLAVAGAGPGTTHLLVTEGIEVDERGTLVVDAPRVPGEVAGTGTIVEVGPGSELVGDGTVAVVAGSLQPVTLRGAIAVENRLDADRAFTVDGDLTVQSIMRLDGNVEVTGTVWARFGRLSGDGFVRTAHRARIGSTVGMPDGGRVAVQVRDGAELSFEDQGSIDVDVVGAVDVTTDVQRNNRVFVYGEPDRPSALRFTGTWTNRGSIWLASGTDHQADLVGVGADTAFVNDGTLTTTRTSSSGLLGSTIDAAEVVNTGEVRQGRDLTVTGDLANEDRWVIFSDPLVVAGDLALRAPGTVHLVIGDLDQPPPITVGGTAALDGTLLVQAPSATPAVGDTALVLVAGRRTGRFRSLEFTGAIAYDVTYTSTRARLTVRSPESPVQALVRALHQDLLGRQPTAPELADRVDAIEDGRLSAGSLVRQLVRHPGHLVSVVDRIYVEALGHHGDAAGRDFWVEQLRRGRRTVAQVTATVGASPEAHARAGGTDAAWVDALFLRFLDRGTTEDERGYWVTRIADRGRGGVALDLFQSPEPRRRRVQAIYRALLGRAAEPAEAAYWMPRLAAEGDLAVITLVAGSPAYARRAERRYP